MKFEVGDAVEWTPMVGRIRHGKVSRVEGDRVYVTSTQTNTRGRRVTRTVECWFEQHELSLLRKT